MNWRLTDVHHDELEAMFAIEAKGHVLCDGLEPGVIPC